MSADSIPQPEYTSWSDLRAIRKDFAASLPKSDKATGRDYSREFKRLDGLANPLLRIGRPTAELRTHYFILARNQLGWLVKLANEKSNYNQLSTLGIRYAGKLDQLGLNAFLLLKRV